MFSGRIGIADYWKALGLVLAGYFLLTVTSILFSIILLHLSIGTSDGPFAPQWILPLTFLYFTPVIIMPFVLAALAGLSVRRLHDLELPGWMILLIIPLLPAVFRPGKLEVNRYGPPIKYRTGWSALFGQVT